MVPCCKLQKLHVEHWQARHRTICSVNLTQCYRYRKDECAPNIGLVRLLIYLCHFSFQAYFIQKWKQNFQDPRQNKPNEDNHSPALIIDKNNLFHNINLHDFIPWPRMYMVEEDQIGSNLKQQGQRVIKAMKLICVSFLHFLSRKSCFNL